MRLDKISLFGVVFLLCGLSVSADETVEININNTVKVGSWMGQEFIKRDEVNIIAIKSHNSKTLVYLSETTPSSFSWLGGVTVTSREDEVLGEIVDELTFLRCKKDEVCKSDYPLERILIDKSDNKVVSSNKRVVVVVEIPNSGRMLRFK